jgi:uncharacterized protein (TIGR03435 family)
VFSIHPPANSGCTPMHIFMLATMSFALVVAEPLLIQAQEAATETGSAKAPLAFEVATVKADDPRKTVPMEVRVYPGGRLVIHAHNLGTLIWDAFGSPGLKVTGGEHWLNEHNFDIEAKPPEELRNSVPGGEYAWFGIQDAKERAMLQALLIERFHLKYHMEKHPGTVYLLKRSAGPLRLQRVEPHLYTSSEDGTVSPSGVSTTGQLSIVGGAPVSFQQTSMLQLANALSGAQSAPVIDETQLPGFYNFKSLTVVTEEDFKSGSSARLLPEALPEMGLKLVKTPGTVEKLVIDKAELPTEN